MNYTVFGLQKQRPDTLMAKAIYNKSEQCTVTTWPISFKTRHEWSANALEALSPHVHSLLGQ